MLEQLMKQTCELSVTIDVAFTHNLTLSNKEILYLRAEWHDQLV